MPLVFDRLVFDRAARFCSLTLPEPNCAVRTGRGDDVWGEARRVDGRGARVSRRDAHIGYFHSI